MKLVIDPTQKVIIIDELTRSLADCQDISAAYLFGSFNHKNTFSDIDIAILTRSRVDNPLTLELALSTKLERVINYLVDIRIINEAPISFAIEVFRTGKVILDRDPDFRTDFECIALKKYIEFSPFRRRYLKEVADAAV